MRPMILFLSLLLSVTFSRCKDEIIAPDDKPSDCTYPPGNRNFTWQLDTVAWFPSTLGGVWAFSDDDAYAMGYIVDGSPPYTLRPGRHWNGTVWEDSIHGTWGYDNVTETWGDIAIDPRNDITGDDFFMVAVGYWGDPAIKAGVAEFDNRTKKWKSHQFQTRGELRSVWTDGKGYFIAAGDSGMVYIKDGYSAAWVYQKAPTDFRFYSVTGISKKEIYMAAYQSLATGEWYTQGWKFELGFWRKLFDTKDTMNTPLGLVSSDYPNEMGAWRCDITDSLKLYVIGDESYLFQSKGQLMDFRRRNLSSLGLPLKANGRTGTRINVLTPNDIWVIGTRYNFYHWDSNNFQKMIVPGLPNDDTQFGFQLRFVKTRSGKLFLPSEVSSQIYVVIQGVP